MVLVLAALRSEPCQPTTTLMAGSWERRFCIVGIIVAGQAAVDGLAEQRDQVVADVAAGTAFLEIVGGYGGKAQGIIQFSECQQSGVGGDGGTM